MVKQISKFFHSENSVRFASLLLIFTLSLSNILGLLRDHLLARYINTNNLDVYFAAFRVPDLVFNCLILGAIFSALVPIFSNYKNKGETKEAWYIVNTVLNIAVIAMIISALIMYFILPHIMHLLVSNFPEEKINQTIKLSRILMLTPIFFSASYVISGVLNTYNRFVAYSFAPLVYNLSIIIGIILFGKNIGTLGVVYFVVIGSFLHLVIQIPSAIKMGYKYCFTLDYKNKAVKKIITLMLPRTIGLSANQILLLVYTSIASSLAAGSVSAFNFANNIQTVPTVVFGGSLATAVFPTLTSAASDSDHNKYCRYLNKTIRTISYTLIPFSVLFILLRAQIVRLILGAGFFAWTDTQATAMTLAFFALALLPQGLIPLFARAFYAIKNTKTPMYAGVFSATIGILLAYLLTPYFKVGGLALAFSVSSYINAILLYYQLAQNTCYKPDKELLLSMLKILFITFITSIVMQLSKHLFSRIVDMTTFVGIFSQTLLVIVSSAIIYLILSKIIRLEELNWAIKRRVR